jgi:hypothetical protein
MSGSVSMSRASMSRNAAADVVQSLTTGFTSSTRIVPSGAPRSASTTSANTAASRDGRTKRSGVACAVTSR